MGFGKQLLEKTKVGTTAQKCVSWATFVGYMIAAYGLLTAAIFIIGGGIILISVLLLFETWEAPSATVLVVDFFVAFVAFVVLSNERFRESAWNFVRQLMQKI